MKKRILSLLLAVLLALPVSAAAAENSTANFVRTKAYTGQFSDLAADSVFYDNVAALYEYGLSIGKADGSYGLQDSMTVGEVVIFASRIRSLYASGDAEAGANVYRAEGQRAWQAHLLYLKAQGVLGTELDADCAAGLPATRAQVAHVMAGTLPAGTVPEINADLVNRAYATRRFIPDVTEYTPYFRDILTLYRQGISVGSDAKGTFWPDAPVTRGAAAAMLTRMVDPALRLTPDWKSELETRTLGSLVEAAGPIAAPKTRTEMDQAVRHMLAQEKNVLTLQYDSADAASAGEAMNLALEVIKTYCEQSYNIVTCNYDAGGRVTLTFSAAAAGNRLQEYRDFSIEQAVEVRAKLWAEGKLTSGMTEYQIARVYYTWICENCVYDYSAGNNSLAHIPYSLFHDGTAVCDSYTGAYNMLLKLEGIHCTALANSEHIWTVATLDGTTYHIDTTWGDTTSNGSFAFFGMTPEQSWRIHTW